MEGKKIFNVLLADDDPDDRELFIEAFNGQNVNVTTVVNGVQLLEKLGSMKQLPDFVFLDLNMPEKNGKDCLCEIREDPRFKDIFIIIYSTSSSSQDVDDTFNCGADLYITKPVTFSALQKTVASVLQIDLEQLNTRERNNFVFTAS